MIFREFIFTRCRLWKSFNWCSKERKRITDCSVLYLDKQKLKASIWEKNIILLKHGSYPRLCLLNNGFRCPSRWPPLPYSVGSLSCLTCLDVMEPLLAYRHMQEHKLEGFSELVVYFRSSGCHSGCLFGALRVHLSALEPTTWTVIFRGFP